MTPVGVARYMARRCLPDETLPEVRVLDPAAGSGVLAAAVVEELLQRENPPKGVKVTLYELDGRLLPQLRELAAVMRARAKERGVMLSVSIRQWDFLLSAVATAQKPMADVVIANPPYHKLNAADTRAVTHQYAVYGQPNIYGLFMAACASLLSDHGRWCFITPRSWTNGVYFSAVRRHLLRLLHIDAMHVFESRRAHFTDDKVLQEAMITWATAQSAHKAEVVVSSSTGSHDLKESTLKRLPISQIVSDDESVTIALPTDEANSVLGRWKSTLDSLGLKVSTGPVVAFRAASHIDERARSRSVPLLWMQHVERMAVRWPINKKREHIAATGETAWMLVPNSTMVVMRRFSPKEDERRITAAPYLAKSLPGTLIGLENHINYVYRPDVEISTNEALGLAAYLNCRIVDQYFRSTVGNTQVNATDLRKMPVPPLSQLSEIGEKVGNAKSLTAIDNAVESVLGIESTAEAA